MRANLCYNIHSKFYMNATGAQLQSPSDFSLLCLSFCSFWLSQPSQSFYFLHLCLCQGLFGCAKGSLNSTQSQYDLSIPMHSEKEGLSLGFLYCCVIGEYHHM